MNPICRAWAQFKNINKRLPFKNWQPKGNKSKKNSEKEFYATENLA